MTTSLPAIIETPNAIVEEPETAVEETTTPPAAIETVTETPAETLATPRFITPGKHRNWTPTSVTAIAFSLTFVLVSFALLVGVVPPTVAALPVPVDLGVLLLMVPLCALTLAMMVEVLRAAFSGSPHKRARTITALSDWRPGHGEG